MYLTICVPLWNRGYDMIKLLENLDILYKKLDKNIDFNFGISIGDFYSTDINFENEIKKYDYKICIDKYKHPFNIVIGIMNAVFNVDKKTDIIMVTDADTVFYENIDLYKMCKSIEKGKTFYVPICSAEAKTRLWETKYDEKKNIYIPLIDHGGSGLVLVYLDDWKTINVFNNSDYLGKRGEIWGGHDDEMSKYLSTKLYRIRDINDEIWSRPNNRKGEWYSKDGGNHYYY